MILVPLAEGFEEIEAVTVIDVLRRAGLPVKSAALASNPVKGAHGISVEADILLCNIDASQVKHIVIPGGMPGAENLRQDSRILDIAKAVAAKSGIAAAICAGPVVLAEAGLLENKKVTCYPGFEGRLKKAVCTGAAVQADGKIITGKGPGAAMEFALAVVKACEDESSSLRLAEEMCFGAKKE